MGQSEKFTEAMKVIIEEIRKETGDEKIDSIELVINIDAKREKDFSFTEKSKFMSILGGRCHWDKKNRRVVCS